MKIVITESQLNFLVTESSGKKDIDKFIDYASKKLKIKEPVDIKLQDDRKKIKTTGVYRHEDETVTNKPEIRVYTKDRLMADVIRSLAHELEHHKQNEKNMYSKGTKNRHAKKEGDANVVAGKLTYSFGKKNPEIFTTPYKKTK